MRDDVSRLISSHIAERGRHLVMARASPDDPPGFDPFVYTIGNHERGLSDLLVIGLDEDAAGAVLNRLGEIQRARGRAFADGELVDVDARFPLKLVDAGEVGRDEFAVQIGVYYETERFAVSQVVIPDRQGRFPDDPACEPPFRDQPVLGGRH